MESHEHSTPSSLSNAEIADRLASLAQLLSAQKENPYKIRAYQRAAARIRRLPESLDEMVRSQEDLTQFSGIGNVWGKNRPVKEVPIFTAVWLGMLALALIIALTGVRPLTLVNISIVFGMVVMPLTYCPILRAAADPNVMGKHVNSKIVSVLGAIFLALITAAAAAAIPLMILTHGGQPNEIWKTIFEGVAFARL